MRQFRTSSGSSCFRGLWGWLVIALMSGGPLSVYAQGEAMPTMQRESVLSGLGEQALAQMFPDAALWLDLEDGDRALAILWPERRPPARGGLIILADEGGNPVAGLTGTLARALAQRDFAVLTLGLAAPSIALEQVLNRSAVVAEQGAGSHKQGMEAGNPATIDVVASQSLGDIEAAYRSRIREQLVAGVAALKERNDNPVAVVGIGRGSNHIVLNAGELGPVLASVWVGPKFYPQDVESLAEALDGASSSRTLELLSSDDQEQRKFSLKRTGIENFSLQVMGSGDLLSPQNGEALAGRISAWLRPEQL